MFPQYVAHSMEGRARLRHPALGEVAVRSAVQKTLGKEKDVLEVRPGSESMLLILKPGVDVASLCQRLEQSVPVLARPQAEVAAELRVAARARRGEPWCSKCGDNGAATKGFSSGSKGDKRISWAFRSENSKFGPCWAWQGCALLPACPDPSRCICWRALPGL